MTVLTLLLLACSAEVEIDEHDTEVEDDTGGGEDTSDTGDSGQVFELGDPGFTIVLDSSGWSSIEGYYFVDSDDVSTLRAEVQVTGAVQIVIVTVDGDVSHPGTFPLVSLEWVEQVSQAGDSFHYTVNDPAAITWTTLGFADEEYLFGTLDGQASLADSIGGGSIQAGAATIESWPHF